MDFPIKAPNSKHRVPFTIHEDDTQTAGQFLWLKPQTTTCLSLGKRKRDHQEERLFDPEKQMHSEGVISKR
jgi:hypothetical protein